MKSYTNFINEELETTEILLTIFISTLLGVAGPAAGYYYDSIKKYFKSPKEIIKDIKSWITKRQKDKELQKIIDKLKNDEEVLDYLKNPKKKGIKKMLSSKLDTEEMQYLGKLNRRKFENNNII